MDKSTTKEPLTGQRVFSLSPSHATFYCDLAQTFATENEVYLQLYETRPGLVGEPQSASSQLRATVVLSHAHAGRIGRLLTGLEDDDGPEEDGA